MYRKTRLNALVVIPNEWTDDPPFLHLVWHRLTAVYQGYILNPSFGMTGITMITQTCFCATQLRLPNARKLSVNKIPGLLAMLSVFKCFPKLSARTGSCPYISGLAIICEFHLPALPAYNQLRNQCMQWKGEMFIAMNHWFCWFLLLAIYKKFQAKQNREIFEEMHMIILP